MQTKVSALQEALDVVEQLSPEQQEMLLEVVRHRLVERRRDEIARNAAETHEAFREGRARYGSVEDLKRDLSAGQ